MMHASIPLNLLSIFFFLGHGYKYIFALKVNWDYIIIIIIIPSLFFIII